MGVIFVVHAFKFDDQFIILDVESGAIHLVDELVYDIISTIEESGKENVCASLGKKYKQSELDEALLELEQLEESGNWNTPEKPFVPFKGESVVKALCLHIAHDCNLRCGYCFASQGEYQSGRALMPLSVGKKALDFLIARSGKRQHLEVDFFGGEPLMNLDVVKALVKYGRELEAKHNKKIAFTITTNCVQVDQDFVDFCDKEIHNVVLSLDGREHIHDDVRKTVNNKGSFELVMPKAKMMAFARQAKEQSYYVRGTFTKNNLDFSKDVLFLADQGFEQISIEPVVLPDKHELAIQKSDLPQIFAEYQRLAHEYLARRKDPENWFNFFHFMMDLDEGPCIAKKMGGCGAGSEYVAITPQGDIYPCHQFVGQEQHRMGSLITGEFNHAMQDTFRACNIVTKDECRGCWAKYYCSGGCSANAINFNGKLDKPYQLACEIQKGRLECAIGIYCKENFDIQPTEKN